MKKKITLLALMLSGMAFSQESNFSQYSLEADYGFNYARNPELTGFTHLGVGFRYMIDEYWGIKFDYGHDAFDSEGIPGTGATSHRFSAQGVYNIGRLLNFREFTGGTVNMLLHAGFGGTLIDSDVASGTDKAGNVIGGGTLQLYISDHFAIMGDVSAVMNFSQQTKFDGLHAGDTFTGKMLTATIGVTYYFGRNRSTADWR